VTTVACDGKRMASDGYISAGDVLVETNYRKVHKLEDGRILGFAGNGYNWEPVIDYFKSTAKNKKWPTISGNSSILLLEPNGRCLLYDNEGRSFERTVPVAIGSGWQFALGAMDNGASVEEAVLIASKRDLATGGTIFIEELSDAKN
jgi:ATP-dependent protease HslVU (ClpYQ) peptidase subunit